MNWYNETVARLPLWTYSNILFILKVIGGWLCDKFGGKHILGLGLLISIIANMLIPVCARINPYIVIGLRVIIGMGSVSIHNLIFCLSH